MKYWLITLALQKNGNHEYMTVREKGKSLYDIFFDYGQYYWSKYGVEGITYE